MLPLACILTLLRVTASYNVMKYEEPIVAVRSGGGWIINGHFNLVHMVNLAAYDQTINELNGLVRENIRHKDEKLVLQFYLDQMKDRLSELTNNRGRKIRSINWIGSAWKWVAGNPDAVDWDNILTSQNQIIENNNQQYYINNELFKKTQDVLQKVNELTSHVNQIQNNDQSEKLRRDVTSRTMILRDELNELVRGCQLAKKGIINTNLLDMHEVNKILTEVETLPYQNVIEAIEYGTPSLYTNSSWLLYVISMPKVGKEEFNHVKVRGAIQNGRQVDLEFEDVLINQLSTFGILKPCYSIRNTSICESERIRRIPESDCLPTLLKGGHAKCPYHTRNETVIELLAENTVFLTNFRDNVSSPTSFTSLNGTYLIQFFNESIRISDKFFSSFTVTQIQALPPVLTNISTNGLKVGINYVHGLSLKNIKRVHGIQQRLIISTAFDAILAVTLILAAILLWRKVTRPIDLPKVQTVSEGPNAQQNPPSDIQPAGRSFFKGAVVNTVGAA